LSGENRKQTGKESRNVKQERKCGAAWVGSACRELGLTSSTLHVLGRKGRKSRGNKERKLVRRSTEMN